MNEDDWLESAYEDRFTIDGDWDEFDSEEEDEDEQA